MKQQKFLDAAIAVLVAASLAFTTIADERQRVTKINGDEITGDIDVVTDVDLSGIGEGTDTNAVRDIVDASFTGGTQEVNRVTGAFDGFVGRVGGLESRTNDWNYVGLKRDKDDLRVYRKVKDIWTWMNWSNPEEPLAREAPADFLAFANSPGSNPIFFRNGAWWGAVQFWPNGNVKYSQSDIPPAGTGEFSTMLNFAMFAYDETGTNEIYRFGVTATRADPTNETFVACDNEYVRIATTDNVTRGITSATNGLLRTETDPVWNSEKSGYQPNIEDLADIRDGAAKGATALQEHQSLQPATNYTDAAVASATNALRLCDGSAKMLPKYLHERSFDDSYPEAAEEYYRSRDDGKTDGGCSAVRSGNFLYRNFDYPLDGRAEFVVKMSAANGRFASVGVAQVGTNLTEAIVTSGKPSPCYKWLPGATVDGINENGVVAEINVVDGEPPASAGGDIHPLAAVRWALDNGTSAAMVASNLAARIAFPAEWSQNFHWMIADERETWIVENGSASNVTAVAAKRVMTNFAILPDTYAGMGKERYDLLVGGASITNAWYTRAYLRSTDWSSEFKSAAEMEAAKVAWETHTREQLRGHGLWQSVHTSVYDLTNRTLRVAVQETDDWYVFAVPSGGVKVELPSWLTPTREEPPTQEVVAQNTADINYNAGNISILQTATVELQGGVSALEQTVGGVINDLDGKLNAQSPDGSSSIFWNDYGVLEMLGQLVFGDGNIVLGPYQAYFGHNAYLELAGTGDDLSGRLAGSLLAQTRNAILFGDTVLPSGQFENIDERIVRLAPRYTPSATDPTFSNAVLAVGLNIDTNSVAVLNEIAATFGGFPITGTATTIGGLLAALAAAVAWLRKNKIDKLKVTGMTAEATAENGVAKLDDFFKEENTLLTGVIDARLSYPLVAYSAATGLLDRAINVVGAGVSSLTVPNDTKDTLIRLTAASAVTSITFALQGAKHYGDAFPTAAGDYLVTVTRIEGIASGETAGYYVRTIEMTEAA